MVRLIMLQFRNEQLDGWTVDDVKKYEMQIVRYMEKSVAIEQMAATFSASTKVIVCASTC